MKNAIDRYAMKLLAGVTAALLATSCGENRGGKPTVSGPDQRPGGPNLTDPRPSSGKDDGFETIPTDMTYLDQSHIPLLERRPNPQDPATMSYADLTKEFKDVRKTVEECQEIMGDSKGRPSFSEKSLAGTNKPPEWVSEIKELEGSLAKITGDIEVAMDKYEDVKAARAAFKEQEAEIEAMQGDFDKHVEEFNAMPEEPTTPEETTAKAAKKNLLDNMDDDLEDLRDERKDARKALEVLEAGVEAKDADVRALIQEEKIIKEMLLSANARTHTSESGPIGEDFLKLQEKSADVFNVMNAFMLRRTKLMQALYVAGGGRVR